MGNKNTWVRRIPSKWLRKCRSRHANSFKTAKPQLIGDAAENLWLSCQTDVNKQEEIKRSQTKSSDDQVQEKNELIGENDETNDLNQPIYVKAEPIEDNDQPIVDIIQSIDAIDHQTGEIGSHNSDADHPTDEEDDRDRHAVLEAQCCGCLALGAGEQAAPMLEECFGIQAAGALLCGACVNRLRDALHFKRTVVACHARFTQQPEAYAYDAPAAPVIKEEGDLPHDSDADEAPSDSEPNIEESDTPSLLKIRHLAPLKQKKIAKKSEKERSTKKATTGLKINDKRTKIVAEAHFTQLGKSYACNYCEAIVDFDNILTHRYNFHGPAKCPFCVRTFKTNKILKKHKIDEHGVDDNRCNVCDKSFLNLSAHMNSVHKLGPKVKCTECDFESFAQNALLKHKVVHTRERNFKCQYCDKSFRHKNNWLYHERIHKGDKRKVCSECGKAFVQKASLNYHMAKYHPNVKY